MGNLNTTLRRNATGYIRWKEADRLKYLIYDTQINNAELREEWLTMCQRLYDEAAAEKFEAVQHTLTEMKTFWRKELNTKIELLDEDLFTPLFEARFMSVVSEAASDCLKGFHANFVRVKGFRWEDWKKMSDLIVRQSIVVIAHILVIKVVPKLTWLWAKLDKTGAVKAFYANAGNFITEHKPKLIMIKVMILSFLFYKVFTNFGTRIK